MLLNFPQAAAASDGLHMELLDVTTAFLYADLEEEVYLETPEGMFAEAMLGKVLRLLKALYELKQSPRMWNLHIDKALGEFGLHCLLADFCVYAIYDGASRVLLGLFVDDMLGYKWSYVPPCMPSVCLSRGRVLHYPGTR